ncbi:hypothetical protein [Treponema parvum]|uniref:hypothetical protein n=1 Tax=Treponema parvum TaxID=138851 RepID=UPI001AEC465B|nr:hypothetical protein [Treponema parvum]QTQ17194.1 hypothetical protein HXT04_11115 [Treponema parvum]
MTNFTTAGFTSIAKGTKTATQVALAATSSTITTVGNKAIDNYTLGGSFDKSSFMTSLGSIQTWGGVASSALTTGINLKTAEKLKRLGEKGAAISKFYGGAINLGTSFAGKGAEFGTYAIDALANGRGLYSAYDNMGGISMNVASLGAMMDFAGTMMSRHNKSGQSAMSVLAEAFRGQGIYEINIGTNGITGKFGNGGIDVGGNVYDLAKRMSDKSNLAKYAVSNGQAKGEAAYYAYVYGDWTQENTAARIANGKDTLIFDNTGNGIAKTVSNGRGGRTITMRNSGDKYVNAIQLGHESYRNGIIGTTAEQNAETIAAVMGHTEMAVRMEDYQSYKAQGLLGSEVEAYRKGDMTSLFMNAMANYDSSGDYWKLTWGGQLVSDGDGWLKDENGYYINADGSHTKDRQENTLGAEKQESGLLNIMSGSSGQAYNSFTEEQKQQAQAIMKAAGLTMDSNGQWNEAKGRKLNMYDVMTAAGTGIAEEVFNTYYNNKVDYELSNAWQMDLEFSETAKNKAVPESLQEKYSKLITSHLNETRSPSALKDKYMWTIYDKNGVGTDLFKIDKNNSYLDDLIKQTDPGLNGTINKYGCNYMSTIAVPQLLTGNIFKQNEIQNIWDTSTNRTYVNKKGEILPWVRGTDSFVNNPDTVAKLAFNKMGYSNFELRYGWSGNNFELIGNKVRVPYSTSGHWLLSDTYLRYLYNSANTTGDPLNYNSVYLKKK